MALMDRYEGKNPWWDESYRPTGTKDLFGREKYAHYKRTPLGGVEYQGELSKDDPRIPSQGGRAMNKPDESTIKHGVALLTGQLKPSGKAPWNKSSEEKAAMMLAKEGATYLNAVRNSLETPMRAVQIAKLIEKGMWPWANTNNPWVSPYQERMKKKYPVAGPK